MLKLEFSNYSELVWEKYSQYGTKQSVGNYPLQSSQKKQIVSTAQNKKSRDKDVLSSYQKLSIASTDYLMTCYSRKLARALTQTPTSSSSSLTSTNNVPFVSLYHFHHVPSSSSPGGGGGADPTNHAKKECALEACHASDNAFVFQSAGLVPGV